MGGLSTVRVRRFDRRQRRREIQTDVAALRAPRSHSKIAVLLFECATFPMDEVAHL